MIAVLFVILAGVVFGVGGFMYFLGYAHGNEDALRRVDHFHRRREHAR